MEEREILPGQFSEVGRVTGREIQKLLTYCDLDGPGKATDLGTTQSTMTENPNDGLSLGGTKESFCSSWESTFRSTSRSDNNGKAPWKNLKGNCSAVKLMKSTSRRPAGLMRLQNPVEAKSSRSAPAPISNDGPAGTADASKARKKMTLELAAKQSEPVETDENQASAVFLSLGQQDERFCNEAAANLGRFAFPDKFEKPDVGWYKPQHKLVLLRIPEWKFQEDKACHSRIKVEPVQANLDPFSHIDMDSPTSSFARRAAPLPSGVEPLDVAEERRSLGSTESRTFRDLLQMNECSAHASPWSDRDRFSSQRPRDIIPNFEQGSCRAKIHSEMFFEPGKYKINYAPVDSTEIVGVPHSRTRSHSETRLIGHSQPVRSMLPEGLETIPDRSLHRGNNHVAKRVAHVSDWTNDTSRPPLVRPPEVYYDESDPEICAAWLKGQLAFDASGADHAVTARMDKAPHMARTASRGDVRGGRLLESSLSMLQALGLIEPPGQGIVDAENPGKPRRDMCVFHFEHYSSRLPSRHCGEYSSLRRPRSHAPPDFERVAKSGFTTRAAVLRPLVFDAKRSHEALRSWDQESYDAEEHLPPPFCMP